ncbi:MAG: carboxypeptidase regulatory-like domain-containing protein [Planctomycetes bacterium]|nr:carboxypeptidase regulatory-like domain-containing protein [Planctomycetota bacterium]
MHSLALLAVVAFPGVAHSDGFLLKGRVLDSAGKPVADAEVQVWRKVQREGKALAENERVRFEGRVSLRTDDQGRYQTPAVLEPDQPVRVIALAHGMLAARSSWVKPAETKILEVGDIVLWRLRTVTGRVVDRQGKPVRNATVFHAGDAHKSERTTTNADGRFRLPGVPEGRAFLFAEQAGFRFTGILLERAQESAEFVLAQADEPVEPLRTLSPELARAEATALVRPLLERWLDAAARSERENDKSWPLDALAYFDPFEAFERLDRIGFPAHSDRKELTRGWIVAAIISQASPNELDEIIPFIETSDDRKWAASHYRFGAQRMPAAQRDAKLEWLGRALVNARSLKDPAARAETIADTAAAFLRLGEVEAGTKLVREAERIVRELSGEEVRAVRACALALARIDLPAAVKLVERYRYDNWYGLTVAELAAMVAPEDPQAAERVWNSIALEGRDEATVLSSRDFYATRLCYRMARADSERAIRLARSVRQPLWRLYALGSIVHSLADHDAPLARRCLEELIAVPYEEFAKDPPGRGYNQISALAWVLPAVERMDPQLARECLWRCIARRFPRPATEWLDDEVDQADAWLAEMLARYDRGIARAILEPALQRWQSSPGILQPDRGTYFYIRAAVLIDPRRAISFVNALPEPPNTYVDQPKIRGTQQVAVMLGMQGEQLWRYAAGYWPADFPEECD